MKRQSSGHLHHIPQIGTIIAAESMVVISEQSILKRKLSVFMIHSRFPNTIFFFNVVMNTKVLI